MLGERRPGVRDSEHVTMSGHRAHETSVSRSTFRQQAGAQETLRGPAAGLTAALIGLGLFGGSFGAFHLANTPPEGVLGLLLEISGWLGMLAAARIVTRRWLASEPRPDRVDFARGRKFLRDATHPAWHRSGARARFQLRHRPHHPRGGNVAARGRPHARRRGQALARGHAARVGPLARSGWDQQLPKWASRIPRRSTARRASPSVSPASSVSRCRP